MVDNQGAGVGPFVLKAGEGIPATTEQGSAMLLKATAESTGGAIGLVESTDPPGFETILHRHESAELWYILDGTYDYYADGLWLPAEAGAVVFVPGGRAHGLRAGGDGGRKLTMFLPAGPEGFFHEVHRALETGSLTLERAEELSEKYGIERLGTLPHKSKTSDSQ